MASFETIENRNPKGVLKKFTDIYRGVASAGQLFTRLYFKPKLQTGVIVMTT